ncbi:MAG: 9-O-acetylesterase [Saprospiraceae bacterium]|nr:9-O-acetylesterase [Saprospiraceae bacterium]
MRKFVTCFTLLMICLPGYLSGQLELAGIFSDHMVIQRAHPINVWGNGEVGSVVKASFNSIDQSSAVDNSGRWKVQFPEMKAGGPFMMKIVNESQEITLTDIYIGDVWVCSGQSNMEWPISLSDGAEEAVKNAADPLIRHFKVEHSYAKEPDDDLVSASWQVSGPETVGQFTAVGYYFAEALRNHIDVPIGLLNTSWGGSRIEAWMSAESLNLDDTDDVIDRYFTKEKKNYELNLKELMNQFPGINAEDSGMSGGKALWAAHSIDESKWSEIKVPGLWESQGYEGFDGIGWYRLHLNIQEVWDNKEVEISLAKIDDSDQVWVNGKKVGGTEQAWNKTRIYTFPSSLLKRGDNVISIKVEDTGGGGGIHGDPDNMYLKIESEMIPLVGNWLFRPGAFLEFRPSNNVHHTPTLLYNKMIYPILNFPIKGVIWYQGESNAGNANDATAYAHQFKDMIMDWRKKWDVGPFPFLYVQLANFMLPSEKPVESNWALLRESQSEALSLTNVGEAVIIDIGEADDIHPRNKKDVGYRLSLDARNLAYDESLVSSGPGYVSHHVENNKVVIEFDQEIVIHDRYGYIKGFAIAGEDGIFKWGRAVANGNKVEIWNVGVHSPRYLRYGWADNPDDLNIYNKEGLPVAPFRIKILK